MLDCLLLWLWPCVALAVCAALYSSVHVHMSGGPAAGPLGTPQSFHVHRFSFLLRRATHSPLSLPPAGPRPKGMPWASPGTAHPDPGGSGAGEGVPGASVSSLSASLYTFECEDRGLLDGHLTQLRQRIESGGSTWTLCAQFLHPLAMQCFASSPFGPAHNHLPVLPPEL